MQTRKLALALMLALASTGALAATTSSGTDFLGRPIVHENLADSLRPDDPARILWEDVHNGQSPNDFTSPSATQDGGNAAQSVSAQSKYQAGERALDEEKQKAMLDSEGFPQYD